MTAIQDRYDVAIIGMGPVGVTLAQLLAGFDVSVLIIDAARDVYDKPRAIGMDQEVMRVFQQIGVADALADFVSEYRPSEYRTPEAEVIRRFSSQKPPFPLGWFPYMTFLQPDLERVLRRHAAQFRTVDLRTGMELTHLTTDGTLATLSIRHVDTGDERRTQARFVVGCDGGTSYVRRTQGIAFEDLIFDEPWLVVDMIVDDPSALPEVNIQFCNPARPHTYVVGPRNLRRWEFMLMPGEAPDEMASDDSVWDLLSPWLTPSDATLWRAATYRFHALVAEHWRQDNVFLAGDACHMTPPFLAQGMVQGIKDAVNLAWKLDAVLRGADEKLLDTYEAERRPLVREVIAITKGLGEIICETDPAKAEVRNAKMRRDMAEGRGETVRQDLFPPIGTGPMILGPEGTAGRPAPQPRVATPDGWQLLDEVIGHRFALLTTEEFLLSDPARRRAEALGLAIVRIGPDGVHEEDSVFADWMAKYDVTAILTRPDHMVMAAPGTSDDLDAALDRIAGYSVPAAMEGADG